SKGRDQDITDINVGIHVFFITLINQINYFNMKLFLVFLMAVSFSLVNGQKVASHLLELESNTKWDAVDPQWATTRDAWVAKCVDSNSAKANADLLLLFEANIKWEAVEKSWETTRNAWVKNVGKATTNAQLANLLIELEMNIKWTSVETAWKTRREAWVKELQ
ncbi:MAG TPA: hypothetical protein PKD51_19795, partial [Saprospiraceae bacterium]|nr:hypothetical protein [Saprospiraceae bacterium]